MIKIAKPRKIAKIDGSKRVIEFCNCLKFVEGEMAGKPFRFLNWNIEAVKGIYKNLDEKGNRIVREAYLSVPRKNSKSTAMAALALYHLLADGEIGAQVFIVANDQDQAKVIYKICCAMIEQNKVLRKLCSIRNSRNDILVKSTNSSLKALSKVVGTKHGSNPSFVIYDELHEAANRDLYDVMKTGMGSRAQPLFIAITTAGNNRNSICYEKYTYAKAVINGNIKDPSFFGLIYEPDSTDDWKDINVWKKVNPAWGKSVRPEFIKSEFLKAINSPTNEQSFRRLYLNQWTSSNKRWLDMQVWDKAGSNIPEEDLIGKPCWCGIDLASSRDLTAFVQCFRLDEEKYYIVPHFFLPRKAVESGVNNKIYMDFEKRGFLNVTPGDVVDYNYLIEHILILSEKHQIVSIAYDSWNSTQVTIALQEAGFKLFSFSQGIKAMSPASKDFERALITGELIHNNNKCLTWNADNVEVQEDKQENIKPVKPSPDNKIDGIIAAIMAYDLAKKDGASYVDLQQEILVF